MTDFKCFFTYQDMDIEPHVIHASHCLQASPDKRQHMLHYSHSCLCRCNHNQPIAAQTNPDLPMAFQLFAYMFHVLQWQQKLRMIHKTFDSEIQMKKWHIFYSKIINFRFLKVKIISQSKLFPIPAFGKRC